MVVAALDGGAARADPRCQSVEITLVPTSGLQLAVWIEDAAGTYVDTLFLTDATGRRGLGNRPGVMGARSGPRWPFGRRLDALPIWAYAHDQTFPLIVTLDGREDMLAHAFSISSFEPYYCRPRLPSEPHWDVDTCSSSSTVYTHKGRFDEDGARSPYPPRADLTLTRYDHDDVAAFAAHNPFDAITAATPAGGAPLRLAWRVPRELPAGAYVARVEAARELDTNASYNETTLPPAVLAAYNEYGLPYRGQPSVLYEVPFTLGAAPARAATASYAGYGDPDGLDGDVREPDDTITADEPGSGAQRLALAASDEPYRVLVEATPDPGPPGAIVAAEVIAVGEDFARLAFVAPEGVLAGYEVRYRAGTITDDDFATATPHPAGIPGLAAGSPHAFSIPGLEAATRYSVGIRALDACGKVGPLTVLELETAAARADGCGCATSEPGAALLGLAALALARRRRR